MPLHFPGLPYASAQHLELDRRADAMLAGDMLKCHTLEGAWISQSMKPEPVETVAPAGSKIQQLVPGCYFHDSWSINAAEPDLDPLSQYLRTVRKTPAWVDKAMTLRNRLVSVLGLKNLGEMSGIDEGKPASAYQPGDRVGIFTLLSKSGNEVLLGDSDKHLDVVVSLHQCPSVQTKQTVVTVTTVVKVHNWLGRLYMVPVRPAHRIIARTTLLAVGHGISPSQQRTPQ